MRNAVALVVLGLCVASAPVMSAQEVQDAKTLKTAPKRTAYVAPVYPDAAKQARVAGIVVAEALIDAQGNVADVTVLRSVAGLDQAAVDAVKQWKYEPTLLNGKPVQTWITVTVNFSLEGPKSAAAPVAPTPAASGEWPLVVNGQAPIRVGGNVAPPERTKYVQAQYPAEARDAGVTGIVILEVVVAGDGKVAGAHVVRSVPLLDQAAVDAVMQWEYAPVHLNGAPVPLLMTVTVNFTLK